MFTSNKHEIIKIPSEFEKGGQCDLSSIDILSLGRAVPMIWFYKTTMDPESLLKSLEETLIAFPALCGRYSGA